MQGQLLGLLNSTRSCGCYHWPDSIPVAAGSICLQNYSTFSQPGSFFACFNQAVTCFSSISAMLR